jgi:prepilin-type N-terminal cleavage/methylation domain-containing protein
VFGPKYPIIKNMLKLAKTSKAFTLVEVLIVIVVIGILAGLASNSYSTIRRKARYVKVDNDLKFIAKAIDTARLNSGKSLIGVSGLTGTLETPDAHCGSWTGARVKYPLTDDCWNEMNSFFTVLENATGENFSEIKKGDPWGYSYMVWVTEGLTFNVGWPGFTPNCLGNAWLYSGGKDGIYDGSVSIPSDPEKEDWDYFPTKFDSFICPVFDNANFGDLYGEPSLSERLRSH